MTTATASKETAGGNVTPMRKTLKAVAAAVADTAPPAALTVPAIEPLGEYRAHEHRRKLDAQGEIDLIDDRERRADALSKAVIDAFADNCDAEIRAAVSTRDRAVTFESQRRAAERQEAQRHREQHVRIVAGAEAAIAASPVMPVADSAVRLPQPSED